MRLLFSIMLAMLLALLSGCRSRPDGVDYNQWKEALKTVRRLDAPDVFNYNQAMNACRRAGKWEEAVRLLDVGLDEAQ